MRAPESSPSPFPRFSVSCAGREEKRAVDAKGGERNEVKQDEIKGGCNRTNGKKNNLVNTDNYHSDTGKGRCNEAHTAERYIIGNGPYEEERKRET